MILPSIVQRLGVVVTSHWKRHRTLNTPGPRAIRHDMTATAHDVIIAELPALLPRLWRYGLVLSRDPVTAEDLVQATCVRALERSSQFTVGTRLDRWLFSILRSIWINQVRAQRIRTGQGLVDPEEVLVTDGVQQIEMNIFAAQVFKQVQALPEAQRETVLLVYVEGLTYQEAASVLNVPPGTVMSRLAAARLKLRGLQESSAGEGNQEN
jgi:RNA polymerase sigma-70 factor, ECF subfamily